MTVTRCISMSRVRGRCAHELSRATGSWSIWTRQPASIKSALEISTLQWQAFRFQSRTRGGLMALKITPKKQVTEDPRHTQAVQSYESGLRALQEHKFEKAKGHLQKVLIGPNKSLVDRAQGHIITCDNHMEKLTLQFKTTEEHYEYTMSLSHTR